MLTATIGNKFVDVCDTGKILCFTDFLLVKNNFCLHFATNFIGDIYRRQAAYRECMAFRTDFAELSAELIGWRDDVNSAEYLRKLYEAYRMMRPYAVSNKELFQ